MKRLLMTGLLIFGAISSGRTAMAKKIDKEALANKIKALAGLDAEERSELLGLLSERKKYGLVWEEKPEDVEEAMREQLPVLAEVKERAIVCGNSNAEAQRRKGTQSGEVVQTGLTGLTGLNGDAENPVNLANPVKKEIPNHILIEGDNLHALTCLTYTHSNKVDVIYIDPPYNTGNKDFVYNDSFVDKEDAFRHSKWLSFMEKRLRIAKGLLSDKGVIFISIDDNEQAQLKLLCDEIFGEENFIAVFPRLATKSGKTPLTYMVSHDYVMCYVKHDKNIFCGIPFEDASYKYQDEFVKERGRYNLKQPLDCNSISYSASLDYIIEHEGQLYYPGGSKEKYEERKRGKHKAKDYAWRWSRDLYEFGLRNGWVVFKNNRIYTKGYLQAVIEKIDGHYQIISKEKERKLSTIDFIDNVFSNDIAKKQLASVGVLDRFDFPKPLDLLVNLMQSYRSKAPIVLDFFAGSGTTLHAVMKLNAEDGGKRKCILVTNNENGICEKVTYERNRRVIQGYTNAKGEAVPGLQANSLRYYKTEFVPRRPSPRNARALMAASVDLLCVKNDLYDEVSRFFGKKLKKSAGRYFDDGRGRRMLVLFDETTVPSVAETIRGASFKGKVKIYVFAHGDYAYNEEFEEVADKVELCALPAAIRNAYRRVIGKYRPQEEDAK